MHFAEVAISELVWEPDVNIIQGKFTKASWPSNCVQSQLLDLRYKQISKFYHFEKENQAYLNKLSLLVSFIDVLKDYLCIPF